MMICGITLLILDLKDGKLGDSGKQEEDSQSCSLRKLRAFVPFETFG